MVACLIYPLCFRSCFFELVSFMWLGAVCVCFLFVRSKRTRFLSCFSKLFLNGCVLCVSICFLCFLFVLLFCFVFVLLFFSCANRRHAKPQDRADPHDLLRPSQMSSGISLVPAGGGAGPPDEEEDAQPSRQEAHEPAPPDEEEAPPAPPALQLAHR